MDLFATFAVQMGTFTDVSTWPFEVGTKAPGYITATALSGVSHLPTGEIKDLFSIDSLREAFLVFFPTACCCIEFNSQLGREAPHPLRPIHKMSR